MIQLKFRVVKYSRLVQQKCVSLLLPNCINASENEGLSLVRHRIRTETNHLLYCGNY